MSPWAFTLAALATYRLTLLATADRVTGPLRDRAIQAAGEESRVAYFVTCPWCVSVWVAVPVVASAIAWGDGWGWQLPAGALAASAVTGIAASYAAPS